MFFPFLFVVIVALFGSGNVLNQEREKKTFFLVEASAKARCQSYTTFFSSSPRMRPNKLERWSLASTFCKV
jgi:hypothetical protein